MIVLRLEFALVPDEINWYPQLAQSEEVRVNSECTSVKSVGPWANSPSKQYYPERTDDYAQRLADEQVGSAV